MLNFLFQTVFFFLATMLVYWWVRHPQLNLYTLQFIGALVLFFFLASWWQNKNKNKSFEFLVFLNMLIFSMVALLLIFATGGPGSPLYFLSYFILFITSLLLSPLSGIVFALILILFLLIAWPLDSLNLGAISSLLAVSPLSYLVGKYYMQTMIDRGHIQKLQQTNHRQQQDIKNEETDTLMWLSLDFENSILNNIQTLEDLLASPYIKGAVRQKLGQNLQLNRQLLEQGRLLKDKIDGQTD